MTSGFARVSDAAKGRNLLRLIIAVAIVAAAVLTDDLWRPLFANADTSPITTARTESKQGVPVLIDTVGERRDSVTLQAIGTARAINSVMLFADSDGLVIELPVHAGDRVAKDDLILRLDDRQERLAVSLAKTRVDDAESALERTQSLKNSNVKSAANVRDDEVTLERARLELRQARETLADRTLTAPFAGIVGIPKIEVGDRISDTTQVVSLDDRSSLQVEFEVAERYFARLSDGMAIRARTPSRPDQVIEGAITRIDSRIDPVARTVLVRATFPNADDTLRPGMSLGVTLNLEGPMLATVPELSVQWRDGKSYVWRIRDGKAERVDVTARRRLNQTVLVEGDLTPGDQVVVEGVQRLRPGAEVRISGGGA